MLATIPALHDLLSKAIHTSPWQTEDAIDWLTESTLEELHEAIVTSSQSWKALTGENAYAAGMIAGLVLAITAVENGA